MVKSLKESIGLDELLLVETLNLPNPNEYYRLITTLRNITVRPPLFFPETIPLLVIDLTLKLRMFNFGSVSNHKRRVPVKKSPNFDLFFDYFDFWVTDGELLLFDCNDSVTTGPDKSSSFVKKVAQVLSHHCSRSLPDNYK